MPHPTAIHAVSTTDGAKIRALDGLRGLAALIVVVSHYSNETHLWNSLLGAGAGQTGVMIFFLLSGFLMTYLHIREPFTASSVRQYALRRFARVYPLFALAALLPLVLLRLHFPGQVAMQEINSVPEYFRQIGLIDRGALVFWTIRVELLFYAVFIGIWWLHSRLGRDWTTAALLLAALVLLRAHNYTFRIEFFEKVHYFLFGLLTALAWRKVQPITNRAFSFASLALLAAFPLTYPQVWVALWHHVPIPHNDVLLVSWRSDLVALLLIAQFNFLLREGRWAAAILSSPVVRWLGKVSYSIYLLHYFLLFEVLWLLPERLGHVIRFSVFFCLALLVSELSNRFAELPLQRLVLSFANRIAWPEARPNAVPQPANGD
jgi:peptidoglycan/LPS O-acetylase OafA/YrhL